MGLSNEEKKRESGVKFCYRSICGLEYNPSLMLFFMLFYHPIVKTNSAQRCYHIRVVLPGAMQFAYCII